jgi:hypothetical protein
MGSAKTISRVKFQTILTCRLIAFQKVDSRHILMVLPELALFLHNAGVIAPHSLPTLFTQIKKSRGE